MWTSLTSGVEAWAQACKESLATLEGCYDEATRTACWPRRGPQRTPSGATALATAGMIPFTFHIAAKMVGLACRVWESGDVDHIRAVAFGQFHGRHTWARTLTERMCVVQMAVDKYMPGAPALPLTFTAMRDCSRKHVQQQVLQAGKCAAVHAAMLERLGPAGSLGQPVDHGRRWRNQGPTAVTCGECGQGFGSETALKVHAAQRHGRWGYEIEAQGLTRCQWCHTEFHAEHRLLQHWRAGRPACLAALAAEGYAGDWQRQPVAPQRRQVKRAFDARPAVTARGVHTAPVMYSADGVAEA